MAQNFLSNPLCGMLQVSQKRHTEPSEHVRGPYSLGQRRPFVTELSAVGPKFPEASDTAELNSIKFSKLNQVCKP